jgi:hypothetical protein
VGGKVAEQEWGEGASDRVGEVFQGCVLNAADLRRRSIVAKYSVIAPKGAAGLAAGLQVIRGICPQEGRRWAERNESLEPHDRNPHGADRPT